jgi:phosphoribosyl-AMP cyclohydrolase / phosphoribosyl-ATP pyrophosphohydrolase
MIDPDALDFDKGGGLIPAIVQDVDTLQVLTLAYMDRAALEETIESGEATFFSRSRGGRWRKGETSGDRLAVRQIIADCDGDALVVKVRPAGNACHLNRISCFGDDDAPGVGRLGRLERTLARRATPHA